MLRRRATRGSGGRRCVADGCARSVRPGRVLCPAHARGAYGRELEAAIGRMARQVERAFTAAPEPGVATGPDRRLEVVEAFARRVARGEYGELFEGRLREVMAQAAAERGIAEEIGALRVVLARLMTDPGIDPLHLAHGVARVAGTTVRTSPTARPF